VRAGRARVKLLPQIDLLTHCRHAGPRLRKLKARSAAPRSGRWRSRATSGTKLPSTSVADKTNPQNSRRPWRIFPCLTASWRFAALARGRFRTLHRGRARQGIPRRARLLIRRHGKFAQPRDSRAIL